MKNMAMFFIGMLLVNISANAQQVKENNSLSNAFLRNSFYASMMSGNLSDSASKKDVYLGKYKTQRTIAWVMLGAGVGMGIAGVIVFNQSDWLFEGDSQTNTGETLFLVGACTALGSIPFFISSKHNKKKAGAIGFKNQELFLPHENPLVVKSQPAVAIKINL